MILKRFIIFFSLFFAVIGCNKLKGPKKPEHLISKEKMVDILIDIKLISSASSKNKLIMRNHGVNLNTYVYEKYNIDSLQFALSNSYYSFHVKEYEEIYTKLVDSLTALKDQLKANEVKLKEDKANEWKEEAKKNVDSLKKFSKKNKDSLGLRKLLTKKNSLKKVENKLLDKSKQELEGLVEPISDIDSQQKQ